MKLTVPAHLDEGIWYPDTVDDDRRADTTWSHVARANAVRAAAATGGPDPFAKYPHWIRPYFVTLKGCVLDAGCGYGRVSIPLLRSNQTLRCVGVDASPVMLKKFVELSREHCVQDRVELYCGNVSTLPFPDASFQSVLSCAVLLHNPKREIEGIIGEFRRILVDGGTLILAGSFPNVLNPEGFTNLRNNFRATENGPVRAYTRSEVKKLFQTFTRVSVEAHQMLLLPRGVGSITLPWAGLSRALNRYLTEHWMNTFKHSAWFVNHHDVIATK